MQTLWRTVRRFLKKLRIIIGSSKPSSGDISGENYDSKRYMHPNVHSSTIYNSLEATYKYWKQPISPWTDECIEKTGEVHINNGILLSHKEK